jgi:hypothetical protein
MIASLGRRTRPFLIALALLSVARAAPALPVISEVLYDVTGSDDGALFVEIFGTPGLSVEGWVVEGVNGSDGEVTHTLALTGTIPADGVLVIADESSGGGTLVPGADLLASFDLQNGPDSVVLRDAGGAVVDALGYGAFEAGEFFAGEGQPAADPPAGSSVARRFADVDTGDNAADFAPLDVPTPGTAPLNPVPEPAAAVLLLSGLAALAPFRRRSFPPATA